MLRRHLEFVLLASELNIAFFWCFEMQFDIIEVYSIGKGILHIKGEYNGLVDKASP